MGELAIDQFLGSVTQPEAKLGTLSVDHPRKVLNCLGMHERETAPGVQESVDSMMSSGLAVASIAQELGLQEG